MFILSLDISDQLIHEFLNSSALQNFSACGLAEGISKWSYIRYNVQGMHQKDGERTVQGMMGHWSRYRAT